MEEKNIVSQEEVFDPETCPLDVLRQKIDQYENEEDFYNTMQLSAKTFINSVYGVFGTEFFNLANTDIAESITLQGQDLIKYSVVQINDYIKNLWNQDYEGHKRIADRMKEIFGDAFAYDKFIEAARNNKIMVDTMQIYGDTDSAYITMQPVIDACYIPKDQELEFDLAFYDEILEAYMDGKFDEYAAKFNCKKNLEKFELEKISRTIIMLAKKNYMCDVEWIDSGARFEPTHHITYTGFDVVKGSTPEYCRKEMKDFVTFVMGVLNTGRKPTLGEIVKRLVDIKKRFSMQSPNDIAKSTSISNYESFVMNDKGPEIKYFEFKTALDANGQPIQTGEKLPVPIHVRAAAIYNNMLFNKAKKYRSKYNLLKSGDKVRFYYTGDDSVFGFVPDLFPMEFAPKMNIDIQFEKMLLSPLNRIIVALGYNEIAPTLTYTPSLF